MCLGSEQNRMVINLHLIHSAELADGLWLAIMRHSKTRGTRLLGSIQIETGKAPPSEENKICLCPLVLKTAP
jgi:hypothetical protein